MEHAAQLRRGGDWAQARAEWKALWEADRSDAEAALAYGNLCLQDGAAAEAEEPLRSAAEPTGALSPFAQFLLARSLHEQGLRGPSPEAQTKNGEAERLLQRLAALPESAGLQERSLRLLAEIQRSLGQRHEEISIWRRILASRPARNLDEEARFRLAQALEGAGQVRAAYEAYQEIYWMRSKSPYAREAGLNATRLARAKGLPLRSLTPQQTLDAARRFFQAGRSADALDLLDALPAKSLAGDRALDARLLRVQVLYALRENGKAVAEADRLIQDTGPRKHGLMALLKASWALLRSGDHEGILTRGRRILEGAGDAQGLRAEALYCMGTSAYARGRFAEASAFLAQMENPAGSVKGQSSTQISGFYKRAWCLYRMGDLAGARSLFARLATTSTLADIRDPSAYWEARCALELGQAASAAEGFTRVAQQPPSYWGLRARGQLAAMRVSLPPEPVFGAPPDAQSALLLPGAQLARELDLCGLEGDAARAFGPVYAANKGNPSVPLALALLLTRGGDAGGGRAVLGRSFGGVLARYEVEKGWLAAGNPAPYLGLVRSLAEREGVDPAFVYGIIKQESDFDEAAVSPTNARGLMQLMPATAAKVAYDLGKSDPSETDLLNPLVNLELGVRYLAQRTKEFPPAAAAASYNAGEDIVGGWLKAWGPVDEEQFIAMIPYAETRHYAAVVLWNRHRYQQVLGSE